MAEHNSIPVIEAVDSTERQAPSKDDLIVMDWSATHIGHDHDVLPYDPDNNPGQHKDDNIVERKSHDRKSNEEIDALPNSLKIWMIDRSFSKSARKDAKLIKSELKKIAGQISELVDSGKNIAVVTPHLELSDIGHSLAGLLVATKRSDYLDKTNFVVNKVMAFETHNGTSIVQKSRKLGRVIFAWPSTESSKNWKVSEDYKYHVNRAMITGIKTQLKKGGSIVAFAPTGTRAKPDGSGRLETEYPSPATLSLIDDFDACVLVTIGTSKTGERRVIVELVNRENNPEIEKTGRKKDTTMPEVVMKKLSEQVKKVTDMELVYKIGQNAAEPVVGLASASQSPVQ